MFFLLMSSHSLRISIASRKCHKCVILQESEKSKKTVASMLERPADRAARLSKEKEEQAKKLKQRAQDMLKKKTETPLTNGCSARSVNYVQ